MSTADKDPDRAQMRSRKLDHLRLAASGQGEPEREASVWDDVHLVHEAVPSFELSEVDTRAVFLGRRLELPLIISAMTGGDDAATEINGALAAAAEACGCAMGVGSQRVALRVPGAEASFSVTRHRAPTALLIANIGLPQLIEQPGDRRIGAVDVSRVIDLIRADALAVHLNYLQELVQPEGQVRAGGALEALRHLAAELRVPVIAKETGSGITRATAARLVASGAAAIDVGGRGGTSFALIEAQRAAAQGDPSRARLGQVFGSWGIPTPAAVLDVAALRVPVIATGGIRSGLDGAKALALGATLVGVARPLLQAALAGEQAVVEWIRQFERELRSAMFLTGARTPAALRARVVVTGATLAWAQQLGELTADGAQAD